MFKNDFSKFLSVGTVLIFFLSVSIIDVQASNENMPIRFGTALPIRSGSTQQITLAPQSKNTRPQVKGFTAKAYGIATITEASTTPTSTSPITEKRGLNRALDSVERNMERSSTTNRGLENAREHILANITRQGERRSTTTATTISSLELRRRKMITELKLRIQKLKYQLSQREQEVTDREKQLVKKINPALVNRMKGKILLGVEKQGEAYYLNPETGTRMYLKDGNSAYQVLRAFGMGITTTDLNKIPVGDATTTPPSTTPNNSLGKKLEGKFLLQVAGDDAHGQAWYIKDGKRYYMKDGPAAYEIMRRLSTGINNKDLEQIPIETINLEESSLGASPTSGSE